VSRLILKLEPVIWALFGGGFFVGCLLLPAWILAVGLAAPLGLASPEALSYERALSLAAHPIGRLLLLALIALPAWNGFNHLRHWVIDLRGAGSDGWVAPLCYLAALAVSAIAVAAVLAIPSP